jgi:hypothetical protein
MRNRVTRLLTLATVCATAVGSLSGIASATGVGTFTTITTPASTVYKLFDGVTPANNNFSVAGTASADVTDVDIDCIAVYADGSQSVTTLATSVPVSGGTFSTTAVYSTFAINCRIRAIPTGSPTTGYLGAYQGPIMYSSALLPTKDGTSTPYAYQAIGEEGNGVDIVQDAGRCGLQVLATIQAPSMTVGPVSTACGFALTSANLDPSGTATKTAIRVDGHNAYLPYSVNNFLIGGQSLTVTQPALTTSKSRASNGDFTVTETAPLMRCSGDNTYPPTPGSCPNLVPTGVTFQRSLLLFRAGHQVRIRDTYSSTDGLAHSTSLEYQSVISSQAMGKPGFSFPAHGAGFTAAAPDEKVTGFGTAAASMLLRSDIYAASDDSQANTRAFTWSRPPLDVTFAHTFGTTTIPLALHYSVSVPANGRAFLGFADSEGSATAAVQGLAALAVTDLVSVPTITSPLANANVPTQSTTVKGSLTAGANGLPTSVLVNGHAATIHKTSATAAAYAVTFSEAWGKHTITVVAKDSVGNSRSRAITVTNTPALVFNGAAHRSGSTLSIPLACKSFSASTCYGKVVVKNGAGTTIGHSAVFTITRGTAKTVVVTLSPVSSSVRVYLFQKEPNGTYPLASSKAFSV